MRMKILFCMILVLCSEAWAQSSVDLTHLPFGDSRILRRDKGQSKPAVQSLWLCGVPSDGKGASDATDWMNKDSTWDFTRKPRVEGHVLWQSEFTNTIDGKGNRILAGNLLPNTPTGIFPIAPTSVAYKYDRNPSHIGPHEFSVSVPAIPKVASSPSCVPYGASGVMLTGNALYHGASTLGADAAAYEMLDTCGGQSDGTFTYHTHFLTPCLIDKLDPGTTGHSALMGYINDGFGIYGPRGEDGNILTSADLDECHGHTHPVLWDGVLISLYHYHWTYDFPYNVGCFKGTPVKFITGLEDDEWIPETTVLEQNFPNPFHPTTQINYELSAPMHVTLRLYDLQGRVLRQLVDRDEDEGYHQVVVDAGDLESGVYCYALTAGEIVSMKRLVIVK